MSCWLLGLAFSLFFSFSNVRFFLFGLFLDLFLFFRDSLVSKYFENKLNKKINYFGCGEVFKDLLSDIIELMELFVIKLRILGFFLNLNSKTNYVRGFKGFNIEFVNFQSIFYEYAFKIGRNFGLLNHEIKIKWFSQKLLWLELDFIVHFLAEVDLSAFVSGN